MIDEIVRDLVEFYEARDVQPVILSEYGITETNRAIHLNRHFREQGWLTIKEELGLELLDAGASKVFAVADHQVAHLYVNDPAILNDVKQLVASIEGVDSVLDGEAKTERGIAHERAGDLIAVSTEDSWFTYYYWQDDSKAPDFARTVDIHRKPGYDPVELFIDPEITFPKLHIVRRLLQKKLGFRMLMDLIPLDATLVKGSHGCRPTDRADWPVLLSATDALPPGNALKSTDVHDVILRAVG